MGNTESNVNSARTEYVSGFVPYEDVSPAGQSQWIHERQEANAGLFASIREVDGVIPADVPSIREAVTQGRGSAFHARLEEGITNEKLSREAATAGMAATHAPSDHAASSRKNSTSTQAGHTANSPLFYPDLDSNLPDTDGRIHSNSNVDTDALVGGYGNGDRESSGETGSHISVNTGHPAPTRIRARFDVGEDTDEPVRPNPPVNRGLDPDLLPDTSSPADSKEETNDDSATLLERPSTGRAKMPGSGAQASNDGFNGLRNGDDTSEGEEDPDLFALTRPKASKKTLTFDDDANDERDGDEAESVDPSRRHEPSRRGKRSRSGASDRAFPSGSHGMKSVPGQSTTQGNNGKTQEELRVGRSEMSVCETHPLRMAIILLEDSRLNA